MADYFVEGGDVLENKLGITDPEQLRERLFGKVYLFAGQIRTVNITKQDSSIPFCYADFIEPEANRIFQDLETKNYLKNETKAEFVNNIVELAMDLNALHPFREGNGRTTHLYLQLLAEHAGYSLKYGDVTHEEIIEADKQAFLGNDKLIKEMYNKIVEKIDEESVENLVA